MPTPSRRRAVIWSKFISGWGRPTGSGGPAEPGHQLGTSGWAFQRSRCPTPPQCPSQRSFRHDGLYLPGRRMKRPWDESRRVGLIIKPGRASGRASSPICFCPGAGCLSVLPRVIASPSAALRINSAKQSLLTFMRLLRAYDPRNDNRKALPWRRGPPYPPTGTVLY